MVLFVRLVGRNRVVRGVEIVVGAAGVLGL